VEIIRGIAEGERIVVSANFLLDSESRMQLAASGLYGTLAKDPACGRDVSVRKAERAGLKSVLDGRTWYFSSVECKERFDREPGRYAGRQAAGAAESPGR
jgi:YHS domain-containing protein